MSEVVKCSVCDNHLELIEVKYWIQNERLTKIFCSAECSLKYHMENNNAS